MKSTPVRRARVMGILGGVACFAVLEGGTLLAVGWAYSYYRWIVNPAYILSWLVAPPPIAVLLGLGIARRWKQFIILAAALAVMHAAYTLIFLKVLGMFTEAFDRWIPLIH